MIEVFATFLKLGLTSFGGPIAHLAYFRNELVLRRKWVGEDEYAQLVALCQVLPGPASSQLCFALGSLRAGWGGALAAFAAFTLPSALLLFAFAQWAPGLDSAAGAATIHGLKLVAVAVVAYGLFGMSARLCPDPARAVIGTAAAVFMLFFAHAWAQMAVIGLGACAGLALCRHVRSLPGAAPRPRYGAALGAACLASFVLLFVALPLLAYGRGGLPPVAAAFYRVGALVFGGGHVVLPLLQETVVAPGWVSPDAFLAGYGAAQAVPGPMFTLAAYLGALLPEGAGGIAGATVAVAAIFLPGLLLVAGALPLWRSIAARSLTASAIAGVNAAVVGLLAAALYDPVWKSAVRGPKDLLIALVGIAILALGRMPALAVVAWCVAASVAAARL